MLHAVRCRLVGKCLTLEQHDVGAFDLGGICRRLDLDVTLAADPHDAQALLPDRRDVFGPRVDQRDVEAAFGEQPAEQATHRAGADHNDCGVLKRHDLLQLSTWRGRR